MKRMTPDLKNVLPVLRLSSAKNSFVKNCLPIGDRAQNPDLRFGQFIFGIIPGWKTLPGFAIPNITGIDYDTMDLKIK
jgi:hypothetical protein